MFSSVSEDDEDGAGEGWTKRVEKMTVVDSAAGEDSGAWEDKTAATENTAGTVTVVLSVTVV